MWWKSKKPIEHDPEPPSAQLMTDVSEILKGMTVINRSDDPDGPPRVLCMVNGAAWYHSATETLRMLRKLFPELSDIQIDRAVQVVASRIRLTNEDNLRAELERMRGNRQSWRDQYRPDDYLVTGGRR
jgi:hypothetical protein